MHIAGSWPQQPAFGHMQLQRTCLTFFSAAPSSAAAASPSASAPLSLGSAAAAAPSVAPPLLPLPPSFAAAAAGLALALSSPLLALGSRGLGAPSAAAAAFSSSSPAALPSSLSSLLPFSRAAQPEVLGAGGGTGSTCRAKWERCSAQAAGGGVQRPARNPGRAMLLAGMPIGVRAAPVGRPAAAAMPCRLARTFLAGLAAAACSDALSSATGCCSAAAGASAGCSGCSACGAAAGAAASCASMAARPSRVSGRSPRSAAAPGRAAAGSKPGAAWAPACKCKIAVVTPGACCANEGAGRTRHPHQC